MSEILVNESVLRKGRIELQYLPCLEYFAYILDHDHVYIDVEEKYIKQTYRNRCSVLTANKVDTLTIPVKSVGANGRTKDVKIDYNQDWIRRHLGCLQSAYGKSPFYEYYAPELIAVFQKKYEFLIDLNYDLLTICLRLVGGMKKVMYNLSGSNEDLNACFSAVSAINNKKDINNYKYYQPIPYYQTFGNDFISNLSIVDLIFNTGPEARSVLLKSLKRQ